MIVVIELISRMMHCLEWRNDDDGCWREDGKKKGNAEDATDATRSRATALYVAVQCAIN